MVSRRVRMSIAVAGLWMTQGALARTDLRATSSRLADAYTPSNLSFENGTSDWQTVNQGYSFVADPTDAVRGSSSARISAQDNHDEFGAFVQCIDARDYRNWDVRLSGYIKTSAVTSDSYAGLWFRVDGPHGEMLAFDNMYDRGVVGTAPWRRYTIDLPVEQEAVRLCYGVLLVGEGTAWFDVLSLTR